MKFVLNRKHVLVSNLGLSVSFEKNKPSHVPPELWTAAQGIGAVPEDDLPEEKVADSNEPQDPAARKQAIFDAFEQLMLGGNREDFTAAGAPHGKALAAQLGFSIDSKERDVLWQEYKLADKA